VMAGKQGLAQLHKTDPERAREIASLGGVAAHRKKRLTGVGAHEWTSKTASIAGRKGGLASALARRRKDSE
jgi:general stress protein YciG